MSKPAITWHPEKRQVSDLKLWKNNPRKITSEAFLKLKERISERGFHDVLKIDTDGVVLSGNQRKKALTDLEILEVTVLVPDRPLTPEEKDKVALESNNNDGDWDYEKLKEFNLGTLIDIGFEAVDLDSHWGKTIEVADDDFDVEKELKKIAKPTTKLGDLILMGNHRLICGDSTDRNVLQKLFGEDRASMIYSDPPYNIKLDYDKGVGGAQNYGGSVNDERSDEGYKVFLKKTMEAAFSVSSTDTHVFYWSDQKYIWLVQTLYRELGINNKRVCLWIKNGHNPTPTSAFNKCYEPCTYGTLGKPHITDGINNLNEVLNKEVTGGNDMLDQIGDIWTAKRLSGKEYKHATSKPPQLHQKPILRCTRPGDIILDSFSGSGSTIIAGEQLKRRVYAVELEPVFCDLVVARWEKLTGRKAEIIRDEKAPQSE